MSSTYSDLYKRGMHLRRNTKTRVYNSVFAGYPTGLLIDGSTTETNATNNELQVRNCVLAGMTSNYAVASGSTWDCGGWFNTAGWGNMAYAANSDLGLTLPVSLTAPVLRPDASSPLLTGAQFTGPSRLLDHAHVVPLAQQAGRGAEAADAGADDDDVHARTTRGAGHSAWMPCALMSCAQRSASR